MAFGRTRNRRRQDARERTDEVRGAVKRHGGTALRLLLAVALTAGALFGGRWVHGWALTSPTFALEQVTFTGLHRAPEAELTRLAGLAPGQNLFLLDPPQVEKAIAGHPWIQRVEVTRHFPRGLSVDAQEHEPAGLVSLGELYLVDREGEPFKRVQPRDALDLPLITGLGRDAYVARPEVVAARWRDALAVGEAYVASPGAKRAALSELRLSDAGVTLVVGKDGQEIHLGEGGTAEKLARLGQLRAALESRALVAEVIHLENRTRPGWVAVKLVESAPASNKNTASK